MRHCVLIPPSLAQSRKKKQKEKEKENYPSLVARRRQSRSAMQRRIDRAAPSASLFRSPYANSRLFLHLPPSRARAFSKVPRGGTTVARRAGLRHDALRHQ